MMQRKQLLKLVNCGLGLLFFGVGMTGLFPDALPGKVFHIVHEAAGKVFFAFAVAHIVLNWAWVKNTLLRKCKKPVV